MPARPLRIACCARPRLQTLDRSVRDRGGTQWRSEVEQHGRAPGPPASIRDAEPGPILGTETWSEDERRGCATGVKISSECQLVDLWVKADGHKITQPVEAVGDVVDAGLLGGGWLVNGGEPLIKF